MRWWRGSSLPSTAMETEALMRVSPSIVFGISPQSLTYAPQDTTHRSITTFSEGQMSENLMPSTAKQKRMQDPSLAVYHAWKYVVPLPMLRYQL